MGDNRPVINLKNLNQYIPPQHHFKMESLQSLRDIHKQGDFMPKLGLNDAYFCIPLGVEEESKKFMRFCWEGDLYQFLCLRFHQVIEDSNCLSSENRHFDHNLSRLYALKWKDSRKCSDVLQYSDRPIAGAGVCEKSNKNR